MSLADPFARAPQGTPRITLHAGQDASGWADSANPNVYNVLDPANAQDPESHVAPSEGAQNWAGVTVTNVGTAPAQVTVLFYYCSPEGCSDSWECFEGTSAGFGGPVQVGPGERAWIVASGAWTPPAGVTCLLAVASAPDDPAPPQDPAVPPDTGDRHLAKFTYS